MKVVYQHDSPLPNEALLEEPSAESVNHNGPNLTNDDLLEKQRKSVQPDPNFEERRLSAASTIEEIELAIFEDVDGKGSLVLQGGGLDLQYSVGYIRTVK